MGRFLAIRLTQGLLVLAAMSFLIYGLIGLMPGDPIDEMIAANPHLTSADAEALRERYGLDLPITERYWNWVTAALAGDLGYSRVHSVPVLEVLGPRLVNTLILVGSSVVLAILLAIPIGVYAATHPYTRTDTAVNLMCFAGISIPPFWLALMLIILFAVVLGWFPAGGMLTVGDGDFADRLRHMVLPVATLTLVTIGDYTRHVRAAVQEQIRQDYVRTARAKGLSQAGVVWRHTLRNALIPVVTVVALGFGNIFSGALITETMFAYLGTGKLIYDSILGNDFNTAMVALLFVTLMVLVGNFLADTLYVALDPRISFAGRTA